MLSLVWQNCDVIGLIFICWKMAKYLKRIWLPGHAEPVLLIPLGLPAVCARLRLHDPGQRLPDAPARHQDQGGQLEPDSEEQSGGTKHSHRQDDHARYMHASVSRLGDFFKFSMIFLLIKYPQMHNVYWVIWQHHFSNKNCVGNILGIFCKNLGYFLFQHPVTLGTIHTFTSEKLFTYFFRL